MLLFIRSYSKSLISLNFNCPVVCIHCEWPRRVGLVYSLPSGKRDIIPVTDVDQGPRYWRPYWRWPRSEVVASSNDRWPRSGLEALFIIWIDHWKYELLFIQAMQGAWSGSGPPFGYKIQPWALSSPTCDEFHDFGHFY